MKAAISTLVILIATPALADPGHFAMEQGHNHWLAAGALALALAAVIGAVAPWKGRKASNASERKA